MTRSITFPVPSKPPDSGLREVLFLRHGQPYSNSVFFVPHPFVMLPCSFSSYRVLPRTFSLPSPSRLASCPRPLAPAFSSFPRQHRTGLSAGAIATAVVAPVFTVALIVIIWLYRRQPSLVTTIKKPNSNLPHRRPYSLRDAGGVDNPLHWHTIGTPPAVKDMPERKSQRALYTPAPPRDVQLGPVASATAGDV